MTTRELHRRLRKLLLPLFAPKKFGEIIEKMPKRTGAHSKGGGSSGSKREPLPDAPPTLSELSIPKKLSSRVQCVAALLAYAKTSKAANIKKEKAAAAASRNKKQ